MPSAPLPGAMSRGSHDHPLPGLGDVPEVSVQNVSLEHDAGAAAEPRFDEMGSVLLPPGAGTVPTHAIHIEDVVEYARVRGPREAGPQEQVHLDPHPGVKDVVVDLNVSDRAPHVKEPRPIVPADVVADHRADTLVAADQRDPAIIVVRVVVLEQRVRAVAVGIESWPSFVPFTPLTSLNWITVLSEAQGQIPAA